MRRLSLRDETSRIVTGASAVTAAGTGNLIHVPADRILLITDAGVGAQAYAGASAGTVIAALQTQNSPTGDTSHANQVLVSLQLGTAASATVQGIVSDSQQLTHPMPIYGGADGQYIFINATVSNSVILSAYAWITGLLFEPAELSDAWWDEALAARVAQIMKGVQGAG